MRYLFSSYNYDLTDPGSIPNLFVQHLYLVGLSMLISLAGITYVDNLKTSYNFDTRSFKGMQINKLPRLASRQG